MTWEHTSTWRENHTVDHRLVWIEQLYEEFSSICFQYGVKLKKPVLEIEASESLWGRWDPETRCIRLSKQLIETYEWDIVVGVLKHEMAHQVVSEIFFKRDQHGPYFKTACDMLGVPEEFNSATLSAASPLLSWKEKQKGTEEEAILRKVEKLLALAQSSNEHEAFLAMDKVQDLFRKYNIDRIQMKRDAEYVYLIINHRRKRIEKVQRLISSILSAHFFVSVVYSELFDAKTLTDYKVIELLGTRQNVLMAEYVYHFLLSRVESLWGTYKLNKDVQTLHKSSFQTGVLVGFRKKLDKSSKEREKQEKTESSHSTALILLNDPFLEKFKARRFPKLTTTKISTQRVYNDHFEEGVAEGKRLILNKGISNNMGNLRKLLT